MVSYSFSGPSLISVQGAAFVAGPVQGSMPQNLLVRLLCAGFRNRIEGVAGAA